MPDQPEPSLLTDDQRRRIEIAKEAAGILRARSPFSAATVEPHAVVCLANYLEHGLEADGDDIVPPMPGPLPDDVRDPQEDTVPDAPETPNETIVIKARNLRAGDRSPHWTITERLALDADEAEPLHVGPSRDLVKVRLRWSDEDQDRTFTFNPDDDVALIERGPQTPEPTEPDPDMLPRDV